MPFCFSYEEMHAILFYIFLFLFFFFSLRSYYLFPHSILQMTYSTCPNAQISSNVGMENVTHSTSTVMASVIVMIVRMKRFASEPEGISVTVIKFMTSSDVLCSVGWGSIKCFGDMFNVQGRSSERIY